MKKLHILFGSFEPNGSITALPLGMVKIGSGRVYEGMAFFVNLGLVGILWT